VPVLRFPDGFLWGAATAAYQIEGSPLADGAGASIWHTYSHTPNTIQNGDTGDVACDHYRLWRDDVALMQRLGLRSYRFSTAWGRVLPGGTGRVNQPGLDFYGRLVDALLEAGIAPAVTLYHWDLPQALEDRGGWANPDAPSWFAEYTETMARALGDRVPLWITFNEPWVFVWLGYALGVHAPGRTDTGHALAAARHVLLAHGNAVERLRSCASGAAKQPQVGITLSVQAYMPASDSAEDRGAAERARAFNNEWFLDPIAFGRWPAALEEEFGAFLPELTAADRDTIGRPIDFVGLNYYTRHVVTDDPNGFFKSRPLRPHGRRTEMDWEVYPAGLYQVLREFHDRYHLPLYVTENGAAFPDPDAPADGAVADWERLTYLQSHFSAAHRALAEGVDLRGYYVWSLLDNFEWGFGYSKRFGIICCDFATQKRTLKESALWYRQVIEDNGI
jgi:beta-glucosidase